MSLSGIFSKLSVTKGKGRRKPGKDETPSPAEHGTASSSPPTLCTGAAQPAATEPEMKRKKSIFGSLAKKEATGPDREDGGPVVPPDRSGMPSASKKVKLAVSKKDEAGKKSGNKANGYELSLYWWPSSALQHVLAQSSGWSGTQKETKQPVADS
jgi:hypothetical protein